MHTLRRNQVRIAYALYQGKTELTDSNGDFTGEYEITYSSAVTMDVSISAAKGEADLERFGIDVQYSKTMITDQMNCPINEYSHLWINNSPNTNEDNWDYWVVKVAKSLNNIAYAIKERP